MERRVKERLIGAGILVALAVIVVPELLSGPKPDAGRPEAPAELLALLEQRNAARKTKDFKLADALRDELKGKGWAIEDTTKGARLKRL